MNVSRGGATATLLPNGRVLVAGGGTAAAEIYNPVSGTWTPTAPMHAARSGHTATLLRTGGVLVAGGASRSAEVYDFRTNAWTLTAPMLATRSSPVAALLSNGQVLVAGGAGPGFNNYLASTELYNPATHLWTAGKPMHFPRSSGAGVVLRSGQVLVSGGLYGCEPELGLCFDTNLAELYDPTSGAWTYTGSMTAARYGHTATLLLDGRMLVVGGLDSGLPVSSAEVYARPATYLTRYTGRVGTLDAASGVGFAPGETVNAYWGTPGTLLLGSGTATGQGVFSGASAITFAVPPAAPGLYTVTCVGQSSGNVAVTLFVVTGP